MRLGISITTECIAAVLLRNRQVAWAQVTTRQGTELGVALERVFASVPRRRHTRVNVVVALGPSLAQFKSLHGLSNRATAEVATQVVRENRERFFLRRAPRLVTGHPSLVNGVWWGSAFDLDAVTAVSTACTQAGLRLQGCIPMVLVHGRVLPQGTARLTDGTVCAEATYARGACIRVLAARVGEASEATDGAPVTAPNGLRAEHVHAYAAACGPVPQSNAVASWRDTARPRQQRVLRILASAFIVSLVGVSIVAPGALLTRSAARDATTTDSLQRTFRSALEASHKRERAGDEQRRIHGFLASGVPVTSLVAHVADVLPDSTAIALLRVDSAGGTIVTIAPPNRSVIAPLAHVEELSALQIVGAMTRENTAGAALQRTTVSFRGRWASAAPRHGRTER